MQTVDSRPYEIGKFYLVGSILRFIRHGDPLDIDCEMTPDEAAEYVANLESYNTGKQEPMGVRIFTSNRKPKRKTQK
jgi:hypothetical protein